MLASSKALLTFLCLVCTFFLYVHDHFSRSPNDYVVAPSTKSEEIIIDSQTSTQQIALSSNKTSAHADIVLENNTHTSDVFEEKRSRILQATMMFGDKYIGVNERTLQSHVDHAKRWGYGDHILRREIVGAGQWDKFIFSKILHVLNLIIGELKRPKEERAEWVMLVSHMSLLSVYTNTRECRWYDADTLILNPNIQWELFLPPDTFPDINFIATKNVDGFNAGLFFFRVDDWSVEILSDAYSLRRLRPEIEISGNIEQNALKYLLGQDEHKKHILYQPQLWYNGLKGNSRAETEINEGDMLVHFAGINHDNEEEMKSELMSQWFAKIEQHPERWQVPLEKTKYPREIEAFWRMYKQGKEMLDTVPVRPESQSGPDQEVKRARDELKWAVEELAFDAAHLKKCMDDMVHALKAADNPQVVAGSDVRADQQASGSVEEHRKPAVGNQDHSLNTQEQLATGTDVKTETSEVSHRFKTDQVK